MLPPDRGGAGPSFLTRHAAVLAECGVEEWRTGSRASARSTRSLFSAGRMTVAALPPGLLFSECDTPADYERVVGELYPAILERDEVGSPPPSIRE